MSRRNKLLKKLKNKEYRDEFLGTTVRGSIAYQIQALRRQLNQSQEEFAATLGKKQNQVSRLESAEYGASVQTLIEVASALGIGLLVRFVDWAELLERTDDMSDAALAVTPIDKLKIAQTSWKDLISYELGSTALQPMLPAQDTFMGDLQWQNVLLENGNQSEAQEALSALRLLLWYNYPRQPLQPSPFPRLPNLPSPLFDVPPTSNTSTPTTATSDLQRSTSPSPSPRSVRPQRVAA